MACGPSPQSVQMQRLLEAQENLLKRQQVELQQIIARHQQENFQMEQAVNALKLQMSQEQREEEGAGAPDGQSHGDRPKKGLERSPAMRNSKGEPQDPWQWKDKPTTLMVRRLPRHFTQRQFLELVDSLNSNFFDGLFDFLYLPWDIKEDINTGGYAFVNFVEPEYAAMFREATKGLNVAGKTISVHPARVQGFEANEKHFAASTIGKHPSHRPIFLRGSTESW